MRRISKAATLAVAVIMIGFVGISHANARCYSWDVARSIIQSNGLVPAGQVRRSHSSGRMIEFKLCQFRGRLVYRLVSIQPGRVSKVIIDARSGRVLRRSGGNSSLPADATGASKNPFKWLRKRRRLRGGGGY